MKDLFLGGSANVSLLGVAPTSWRDGRCRNFGLIQCRLVVIHSVLVAKLRTTPHYRCNQSSSVLNSGQKHNFGCILSNTPRSLASAHWWGRWKHSDDSRSYFSCFRGHSIEPCFPSLITALHSGDIFFRPRQWLRCRTLLLFSSINLDDSRTCTKYVLNDADFSFLYSAVHTGEKRENLLPLEVSVAGLCERLQ